MQVVEIMMRNEYRPVLQVEDLVLAQDIARGLARTYVVRVRDESSHVVTWAGRPQGGAE